LRPVDVGARAMTREEFDQVYPLMRSWLSRTLTEHATAARPVASCRFTRLSLYFNAETLESAKVVLVDELPIPPLSSWGLTRFAELERGNFNGITYLDNIFLKRHQSRQEAIHFHELIHVIQWRILGPERFLYSYANGLETFGYRASPMEIMAYGAEVAFLASEDRFDAEALVAQMLTPASG
jgi:hypothetical protein